MPDAIVKIENRSHWYSKDGKPMHEIFGSTGMRKTTLRDARKLGLLPSVTTILSIKAKPGLERWKVEQGIMSALTLPRNENESLQDFASRVADDSMEQVKDAADLGKQIHHACEMYLSTGTSTAPDGKIQKYLDTFMRWADQNIKSVHFSENVLVDDDVAGTADFYIEHKEFGHIVGDIKSQNVKIKELKSGSKADPAYYKEWSYQLAGYADMIHKNKMGYDYQTYAYPGIMTILFDKVNPGDIYWKKWSAEDQLRGKQIFDAVKLLWKLENNYFPEDMEDENVE